MKNGQLDLAVEDLAKAIEMEPDCAESHKVRAEAYRRLGDLDRAAQDDLRASELERKNKAD